MKKEYTKPATIHFGNKISELNPYVPGALLGAALMVGRALAKAMKGGIDLTVGADAPTMLQDRKEV